MSSASQTLISITESVNTAASTSAVAAPSLTLKTQAATNVRSVNLVPFATAIFTVADVPPARPYTPAAALLSFAEMQASSL